MGVARFYVAGLRPRGWHGAIYPQRIPGAASFRKLGNNRGVGWVVRTIGERLQVIFNRGDAGVDIHLGYMMILTDRPLREQHAVWRYRIVIDSSGRLVRCDND